MNTKRTDELGDRMKLYENTEAGRRFMPLLPVCARIDGRSFHNFTRGLIRPFDTNFSECMIATTKHLVEETGACMGYTQSDEITLAWYSDTIKSQIWFNGRVAKMTSQLGAQATLAFYIAVLEKLGSEYAKKMPTFDARVWTVPNKVEGANVFLWRELDAVKNSVSMLASAHFSHKQLMYQGTADKLVMLESKGIYWGNYPTMFKRGTYVQKRTKLTSFSPQEIDRLPPKHRARTEPNFSIERTVCEPIDMPIFRHVVNRPETIFDGATPMTQLENSNENT